LCGGPCLQTFTNVT